MNKILLIGYRISVMKDFIYRNHFNHKHFCLVTEAFRLVGLNKAKFIMMDDFHRLHFSIQEQIRIRLCISQCEQVYVNKDESNIVNGHILKLSENCDCDNDINCQVCDGGLAVCSVCGEFEAGLVEPCLLCK